MLCKLSAALQREVQYAHGTADFVAKLQIALKEANETGYWLELLYKTETGIEFVPDAYKAILEAENRGLITILRYEEISVKTKDWINRTILREYEEATDHPEYRFFLRGNFPDIIKEQ